VSSPDAGGGRREGGAGGRREQQGLSGGRHVWPAANSATRPRRTPDPGRLGVAVTRPACPSRTRTAPSSLLCTSVRSPLVSILLANKPPLDTSATLWRVREICSHLDLGERCRHIGWSVDDDEVAVGWSHLAIELILIGQAVVEPSRSRAPSLPAVGCKGGRRQDRKSLLCDLRDNGHRPSDVRVSRDLPVVRREDEQETM
jgi:hypothetical protein